MPNHMELKVGYEGQLNQIDLDTLLVSLLHLSEMLKVISRINNEELQIRITATERGSFDVFLELTRKASGLFGLLFSDQKSTLDTIHKVVTLLVDILTLKSFLKGKKPDDIQPQNNGFVIIVKDQASITISGDVFQIYGRNLEVNNHMEKMFDKLAENPEVEGFLLDAKNAGSFHVKSNRFPDLAQNNEMLESEEQIELLQNVSVSILKVVFQRNRKWEFIFQGNKISSFITDNQFWDKVDAGVPFSKGDILIVDLEVNKSFDTELNCYVNKSYKIVKVISHRPRTINTRQLDMFN
ncbi:MAG: hypothetical protein GXZ13_00725 [Synergistaceae bacterium]|nr:hypothetical protein [Synergistaceae bacterium]